MPLASNFLKIMLIAVVLYLVLKNYQGFVADTGAATIGVARVTSALDGNAFTGK